MLCAALAGPPLRCRSGPRPPLGAWAPPRTRRNRRTRRRPGRPGRTTRAAAPVCQRVAAGPPRPGKSPDLADLVRAPLSAARQPILAPLRARRRPRPSAVCGFAGGHEADARRQFVRRLDEEFAFVERDARRRLDEAQGVLASTVTRSPSCWRLKSSKKLTHSSRGISRVAIVPPPAGRTTSGVRSMMETGPQPLSAGRGQGRRPGRRRVPNRPGLLGGPCRLILGADHAADAPRQRRRRRRDRLWDLA